MLVEGTDLAVDHAIRQGFGGPGDGGELAGPVEALAGAQLGLAILDPKLHAVAVEFDFMRPTRAIGRALDQLGELRLDELRHLRNLARRDLLAALLLGSVFFVVAPGMPDRAGAVTVLLAHEG